MSSECMDNFVINVRASTKPTLALALRIAFGDTKGATHWFKTKEHGLVLLWSHDPSHKAIEFPSPIKVETAIDFCWEWLENAQRGEFDLKGMDGYYDGDGHSKPAYRVFCEDWGHVAGSSCAICAILPVWGWVGK